MASHPTRVRGLKFDQPIWFYSSFVAPYTGAWIEIGGVKENTGLQKVAPYTGAWIEIATVGTEKVINACRTLHGCVD